MEENPSKTGTDLTAVVACGARQVDDHPQLLLPLLHLPDEVLRGKSVFWQKVLVKTLQEMMFESSYLDVL